MVHPSQQSLYARRRKPQACITVTSNGRTRTLRIRPWVAAAGLSFFVLFLSAYVGATGYLIYRDDLLGATLARQVKMQYAYEDRIAALRSEIDQVTTRNLVQAHGVDEQLALLLNRQAQLQQRHASLAELLGKAQSAGVAIAEPAVHSPEPKQTGSAADRSTSGTGTALGYAPHGGGDDIITGALTRPSAGQEIPRPSKGVEPVVSTIGRSLDGMQGAQSSVLDALESAAHAKLDKISAALEPLGGAPKSREEKEPQGGPFVPTAALHFVERTAMLSRTIDDIADLQRAALDMPLRAPVAGSRVSSRFGYRTDPFLGRPALHSGVDFAAGSGAAVHATGAGTVVSAGWSGGYGQLVEIRHADGVTTRYGHLSAILVEAGARVEAGALIGRVGSTGRSTGPHLHYETRRAGKAVDPALFLAAGRAL